MSKVRSLFARQYPDVSLTATVTDQDDTGWRYELAFTADTKQKKQPFVSREEVYRVLAGGREEVVLKRPDEKDREDPARLTQTAIQQVTANQKFRELAEFFRGVSYLHLVPQLVREEQAPSSTGLGPDPYGRDLLDRMRNTTPKNRTARLRRIERILQRVTPQLEQLDLTTDVHGRPHLEAKFQHWRPQGAVQNESQFSDGTLRLIGLLWSLQEKSGPLLLEEPELSLHGAIVGQLAPFIHSAQKAGGGRQVLLSTHSEVLLRDPGIAPEEVILVQQAKEGSDVVLGAEVGVIEELMQSGLPASEAAYPRTTTPDVQLQFTWAGPA